MKLKVSVDEVLTHLAQAPDVLISSRLKARICSVIGIKDNQKVLAMMQEILSEAEQDPSLIHQDAKCHIQQFITIIPTLSTPELSSSSLDVSSPTTESSPK